VSYDTGMMTTALIGCVAAALASTSESGADGGITSPWLYHAAERAVAIDVEMPAGHESGTLALMNDRGDLHTEPLPVEAGRLDLAGAMPDVWRLRQAAYLQLVVDGEPVGTPLVVQPLLSRLVPETEDALSPSGHPYTRIVDWYDEASGLRVSEMETAAADAGISLDDPWLANQRLGPRLLSGLRIYPEADVILRTTHGDIRIALRPDHAPNTTWNFLELSRGGFYRDIPFHRIVPFTRAGQAFVIQAGDPTGTGSGGPGYWLPIERSTLPHEFGVISMARDVDPDSAGSQIFLCLSRAGTARLDGHYCAFGYAVDGAGVIERIANAELADVEAGRPARPMPTIRQAEVVPTAPRRIGFGRADEPVTRPTAPEPEIGPERLPR